MCAQCATHLTTHPLEALWNKAGGLGSRSPLESVWRMREQIHLALTLSFKTTYADNDPYQLVDFFRTPYWGDKCPRSPANHKRRSINRIVTIQKGVPLCIY